MHVKSHIYHKCCCGSPDEIDLDEYRSFYLDKTPKMYPEEKSDEMMLFYDKFKNDMHFTNWPEERPVQCDHPGCSNQVKIMISRYTKQTYLYPYGSCKIICYDEGELIVKHYCINHKKDGDATFILVDGFISPVRKD